MMHDKGYFPCVQTVKKTHGKVAFCRALEKKRSGERLSARQSSVFP
jgi:hypothetical protein